MANEKADAKLPKLDALLFIDTNIFLDFYRIESSSVSMDFLNILTNHKDKIISSKQVEMEFIKNRQKVLNDTLEKFVQGNKGLQPLVLPILVDKDNTISAHKKYKKEFDQNIQRIKSELLDIITHPDTKDQVYQTIISLFSKDLPLFLSKKSKKWRKIFIKSSERFKLGYPPRKSGDNSIGDSVNWEWIIKCAKKTKKHIVVVTRDNDFGLVNMGILNDWLQSEFDDRVGNDQTILLTNKLHNALEIIDVSVTEEMIKEEETIIKKTPIIGKYLDLSDSYQKMLESLRYVNSNSEFIKLNNTLSEVGDLMKRLGAQQNTESVDYD